MTIILPRSKSNIISCKVSNFCILRPFIKFWSKTPTLENEQAVSSDDDSVIDLTEQAIKNEAIIHNEHVVYFSLMSRGFKLEGSGIIKVRFE